MTVNKAISYGMSKRGEAETPPGSNRSFAWTYLNRHWGTNLNGLPWCGAFALAVAHNGGLKLPWQMISVAYIENWARSRGRWKTNPKKIKKGDFIVLFASGRHVEVAAEDGTAKGVYALGGNTSKANQWNGGQVAYQFRSASDIVGYASISNMYPKPPKYSPIKWRLPLKPKKHYYGKKKRHKKKVRGRIHNGHLTNADKKNVKRLQKWLKYLGYYDGKITGVFNEKTHIAVLKFQWEHNFKAPNGLVAAGKKGKGGTWFAIQRAVHNKRY